ncbi:hypothetical protein BA78_7838 [Aspergillus fumigatus]|nr:hypothetical protein BA78_7838 [Aspergillus fumigatus]
MAALAAAHGAKTMSDYRLPTGRLSASCVSWCTKEPLAGFCLAPFQSRAGMKWPPRTALGEFKPFTSSCAISRPRLDIVNYANGGKWSRTQCATQLQITFSFMAQQSQMRSAPSACTQGMPGLPRLDWRIQRERGWLRVASLGYLNVGTPETKLELSHTDSGRVEELKVDKDEWILYQSLVKILRDYTRHIAEGSRILHSAGL